MFTSQGQGKAFFVDRIVAQARLEHEPLTDVEEWMLRFSESDSEFVIDPARLEQFGAQISEAQYESKVAGLLQRCFQRDAGGDNATRTLYRNAYRKLAQGDHYLLIMIERALGSSLDSAEAAVGIGRMASRVGLFVVLVVPGAVALLMAVGFASVGFTEARSAGEIALSVLAAVVLAGAGYYLIHLWRRERKGRPFAA